MACPKQFTHQQSCLAGSLRHSEGPNLCPAPCSETPLHKTDRQTDTTVKGHHMRKPGDLHLTQRERRPVGDLSVSATSEVASAALIALIQSYVYNITAA